MIHYLFQHLTVPEDKASHFASMVNQLFSYLRTTNKNIQVGVAMTFMRIIQNASIDAIVINLENLTDSILELIQCPVVKCVSQLLESLISLMLAVENEFEPHGKKFVPALIECIQSKQEWSVRKISIDVIYTFAAFLPDCIADDIKTIIKTLKDRKADKIKPVRDAAQKALTKIKEARIKNGQALNETPPKFENESKEENKESSALVAQQKPLFKRQLNPNFVKAAPKSIFKQMINF
jgi:hypothetical protein